MYKLLTTAAVIMTVATPSIANQWTDGGKLASDLGTIYGNLDGETEFNNLQGQNGELNLFFSEVSKGVTHLTLQVNADNTITPTLVEGSDFATIQARADTLVNRVNHDLFTQTKDTDGNVTSPAFDNAVDYTNPGVYTITPTDSVAGGGTTNDITVDQKDGLVGAKIGEVVTSTNLINDGLLDTGLQTSQRTDFITEYNNGDGINKTFNGVDVADYKTTIDELNLATTTANGTTVDVDGNNVFYENTGLAGFTENTVNNFIIPSYNSFDSIGAPTVNEGFSSISDWANGYETVVAEGVQYRYDGAGEATSDGTTISIEGEAVDLTGTLPDGLVKL